jgi:hypothetical protein
VTENGLAPAPAGGDGQRPVDAQPAAQEAALEVAAAGAARAADRPEVPVAAAFAGGFVLAMILKRRAR